MFGLDSGSLRDFSVANYTSKYNILHRKSTQSQLPTSKKVV